MKNLLIALVVAVVVVAGFSANAVADQPISDNVLANMGLNGMETISDAEGMQVRGKLFNINMGAFSDVGQLSQINNVRINNSRGGRIVSIGNVAIRSFVVGDYR